MSGVWNWVLIVAGALLVLVEVALGGFAGFDLVLIGSAFVVGGVIGLAFGSPPIGFVVASVLCVLYIGVGRRMMRRRMQTRPVPSNADALIGLRGIVTQRIALHAPGQVRVRDEIWRAAPAPEVEGALEPGAEVTVTTVDGVTLLVR
ncbi:MAG TPA: NfeD family protein [Candidatus Eisenbacteria bacterium]|jgi:membrane protein implicated in regulation of membrane protease activity